MGASAGEFPIVPPQFMDSFNKGLSGVGNTYKNLLDAATSKAKLPYVPQLALAQIASQMAYAKLMGPQFIAKLMGNKDILANMNDPKQMMDYLVSLGMSTSQAANAIQSMGNNGGGLAPTQNQPSPSRNNFSSSPDQITNQINNRNGEQSTGSPNNGNPSQPTTYGDNSNRGQFWKNSGQALGEEKKGESSGDLFTTQWGELDKDTASAANEQSDILRNSQRFHTAYNNLSPLEKGSFFGNVPAISSSAQMADHASNSMMVGVATAVQQGHITNKDFDIFSKLKATRNLNKGSEEGIVPFVQGTAYRSNERPQFNSVAKELGLSAPQANLIWNRYINDRPFFDPKTNKIINKNMDSWGDYLKPARIKNILSGKEKPSASYSSGGKITKKWKLVNGQLVEG
jgi:hypothetical protein